jgi:hypothetical protein
MNERKCKNCAYALAFFDADESDKKSKTLCACRRTDGKAYIVSVDNICDAHLFAGTGEEREGRRHD